jgi:hypothetical protein
MTCHPITNGIVCTARGPLAVRIPYRGTVYVSIWGGGCDVSRDRDGDRPVDWTARGNERIRRAVEAAVRDLTP